MSGYVKQHLPIMLVNHLSMENDASKALSKGWILLFILPPFRHAMFTVTRPALFHSSRELLLLGDAIILNIDCFRKSLLFSFDKKKVVSFLCAIKSLYTLSSLHYVLLPVHGTAPSSLNSSMCANA